MQIINYWEVRQSDGGVSDHNHANFTTEGIAQEYLDSLEKNRSFYSKNPIAKRLLIVAQKEDFVDLDRQKKIELLLARCSASERELLENVDWSKQLK